MTQLNEIGQFAFFTGTRFRHSRVCFITSSDLTNLSQLSLTRLFFLNSRVRFRLSLLPSKQLLCASCLGKKKSLREDRFYRRSKMLMSLVVIPDFWVALMRRLNFSRNSSRHRSDPAILTYDCHWQSVCPHPASMPPYTVRQVSMA